VIEAASRERLVGFGGVSAARGMIACGPEDCFLRADEEVSWLPSIPVGSPWRGAGLRL